MTNDWVNGTGTTASRLATLAMALALGVGLAGCKLDPKKSDDAGGGSVTKDNVEALEALVKTGIR